MDYWGNPLYCGAPDIGAPEYSSPATIGNDQEEPSGRESSFINAYPNPTTGMVTLEMKDVADHSEIHAQAYGMQGALEFSACLTGEREHGISLAHLPAGIYFIRVTAGEKTETIKIVKQ